MASYEYKCKADGSTQTVRRGMTEQEVVPLCDECNQPMNRVYESTPVKFNATGFYSTGG